jgi:hypothetical protein
MSNSRARGVQVTVNVKFEGGYAAPTVEAASVAARQADNPCRCDSRTGMGEAAVCRCNSQAGFGSAAEVL